MKPRFSAFFLLLYLQTRSHKAVIKRPLRVNGDIYKWLFNERRFFRACVFDPERRMF